MKTVNVTNDDIQVGKRADCLMCPVSLAIARAFDLPWTVEAHVSDSTFVRFCNIETSRYRTTGFPSEVVERIREYDRTGLMDEFSFRLSEAKLSQVL